MVCRLKAAILFAACAVTLAQAQEKVSATSEGEVSRFGQRYDAFLLLFADRHFEKSTLAHLTPFSKEGKGWVLVILGEAPLFSDFPLDLGKK